MAQLDFLDEAAAHLQAQNVGTTGTSIFVNKSPDSTELEGINSAIVVLYGLPGTTMMDQRDVPELQVPRFKVYVRAADYNDAADMFQNVRTALHGLIGAIWPSTANTESDAYIRVLRCHVDQEGGPIGEDKIGRSEFACNFATEYHYVSAPEENP